MRFKQVLGGGGKSNRSGGKIYNEYNQCFLNKDRQFKYWALINVNIFKSSALIHTEKWQQADRNNHHPPPPRKKKIKNRMVSKITEIYTLVE